MYLAAALSSFIFFFFVVPVSAFLGVDTFWGNPNAGTQQIGGRFSQNAPQQMAVYGLTGDVYVADTNFHRIQQFDEEGNFIRAWGFDVKLPEASPQSSATFETCEATEKGQCKAGATAVTTANGGEVSSPTGIAVNQNTGHVYVVEAGLNRIDEFTATGDFVRAFGLNVVGSGAEQADEEQTLTVSATAGQYKLTFGANTTTDIEWNEPASGIEAKLNALNSINAGGGNVSVSGGTGGASSPYLIKFGGARADTNQSAITVAAGTVALTGTATIATINNGAEGYEICNAAATCRTGVLGETGGALWSGSLGTLNALGPSLAIVPSGGSAPNPENLLVAEPENNRLQEFSPTGHFIRAFGWNVVLSGPDNPDFSNGSPNQADEIQKVIVKASGGKFKLKFGSGGAGVAETAELDYNAPAKVSEEVSGGPVSVEAALNAITNISAGGGSVTVSGGPGNATGTNPYVITFAGGPLGGVNVAAVSVPANSLTGGQASTATFVITVANGNQGFEVCRSGRDICQEASGQNSGSGQFATGALRSVAVDPSGRIYTVEATGSSTPESNPPRYATAGLRVQSFTVPGNVPTPQGPFLCAELCGAGGSIDSSAPIAVATDDEGMLYVAKSFLNGTGNPPATQPVSAGTRKYQQRVLKIDPAANGGEGVIMDTMLANPGDEPGIEGDGGKVRIEGISSLASDPSGSPLYAATAGSLLASRSRIYRLDEISGPAGSVSTAAVGATAATLNATIEPAETLGPVKSFYRFEYRREGTSDWSRVPSEDVNVGNGSDAGPPSSSCSEQEQASTCHVSGEIEGLALGRTYEYRLVVRTSYQGAVFTTAPQEFTTVATPPSVATGGAVWSGPPSSSPSLTFNGRINPQGAITTYAFEYVSEADYAESLFAKAKIAPVAPISAGQGTKVSDVVVSVNGLDPSSGYRFRLVATNLAGTSTGDVGSVAASHAGDRFVELVTAGDSQGADVNAIPTVSDDGERVAFTSIAFGADQQAAPWIVNPAIALRGDGGWTARAMAGDPNGDRSGGRLSNSGSVGDAAVTRRLWGIAPEPETVQWAARTLDGALTPISPILSPLDRTGNFTLQFEGASNDLSTLVVSGGGSTLFPGEPLLTGGASNLYKISGAGGATPSVALVNGANGGGVIGGACGANLGGGASVQTNAVSADGSVVYFQARAGAPATGTCNTSVGMRIFKRVGDSPAVEVSACAKTPPGTCTSSGNDFYWGASADGSKVFFSTDRQLTDSDTDSTTDLYLYDASLLPSQPLVQVSAGEVVGGDHPVVGAGAQVQGVVDFAMDGSRAYFVAKGRLTADASLGVNNLYVYDAGDNAHPVQFVAALGPGSFSGGTKDDPRLWANASNSTGEFKPAYALPRYEDEGGARVDGDGHLLGFVSSQPLLPGVDHDLVNDLYRYNDDTGQLACLSCAGEGAQPVTIIGHDISAAKPDLVQRERVASEDGSKFVFRTNEKLLATDTNASEDVYLWDDDATPHLSLISGATANTGTVYFQQGGGPAISPDGRTVFFATRATLLPQDLDNGAIDIYAARVDGGFHQQDTAVSCSSEDACHTGPLVIPPPGLSPGSAGAASSGNVKAMRCKKNQVLRNGKCVRKKPKGKKHKKASKGKKSKGRAGSGQGAGR